MVQMATKTDLDNFKTELKGNIKTVVSEAVNPLKVEMASLSERVTNIENNKKENAGGPDILCDEVTVKIVQMQKKIDDLSVVQKPVVVIGGLSSLESFENAEKWIKTKLDELGAPPVLNTWVYGDFGDIIFVRFANISERDAVIEKITRAKIEIASKLVWANEDAALDVRVCRKFLFGVRKILLGWWGRGARVKVEAEGATKFLKVAGKVVVTVSVDNGQLQCDWDTEWKGWEDFHKSEEVITLVERMVGLLKGGGGKGDGKGKNKNA